MSRKEDIATRVVAGMTTKQIATELGIAVSTVRYHREPSKHKRNTQGVQIMQKLDTMIALLTHKENTHE